MKSVFRFGAALWMSLLAVGLSHSGWAQDTYPKLVSEYSEETAPGNLVVFGVPIGYKDALGVLTKVNTTLVVSSDPAYDYEVRAGIWQLKVKKDGTFQANHEGDSFTYRFNSLGFGRGSQYRKAELGEPDFSRYIVFGNTIRWSDVYPDIDLSVHYTPAILKVNVVVKNAFLLDLKTAAQEGRVDKGDYLTARFDIPQVLIRSQAK